MNFPQSVTLKEIGPRIDFQYESLLTIEQKLQWINHLINSGLTHIEVSSFIRTNNKQQFNEAAELVLKLKKENELEYGVLIPNKRALTRAFVVDADEINFFLATSEAYNQTIKECSIKHSMKEIKQMTSECQDYNKTTKTYIATVFGCPFEEEVNHQKAIHLASQLLDDGVDEISFVDSVGTATPLQVKQFLELLLKQIPKERCSMQFYNTYGRAISNIYTSLSYGIERFDTANGGFGGCFPSTEGNRMVETEDIVSFMHGLNLYTGVDEDKLQKATFYIANQLNEHPSSKLFSVMQTKKHQS